MAKTHYKKLVNPLYLGSYSLDDGKGGYADIVRTIESIRVEEITGTDGKKETCPVARFKEGGKPMILNTTNMKTLAKLFATPYIEDWCGRRITIYAAQVKAFGEVLDALRIRPTHPKSDGAPKCLDCGGEITATEKMNAAQLVAFGQKRYGKALCESCLRKLMEPKLDEPAQTDTVGHGISGHGIAGHGDGITEPVTDFHEPTAPDEFPPRETESGESEFERMMKEGE